MIIILLRRAGTRIKAKGKRQKAKGKKRFPFSFFLRLAALGKPNCLPMGAPRGTRQRQALKKT
jgi:hypothetical protein